MLRIASLSHVDANTRKAPLGATIGEQRFSLNDEQRLALGVWASTLEPDTWHTQNIVALSSSRATPDVLTSSGHEQQAWKGGVRLCGRDHCRRG
jgi:hypothetical protein